LAELRDLTIKSFSGAGGHAAKAILIRLHLGLNTTEDLDRLFLLTGVFIKPR